MLKKKDRWKKRNTYKHTSETLSIQFHTTTIQVNNVIKQATIIFWFPRSCKSYVYTIMSSIKDGTALRKKNKKTTK